MEITEDQEYLRQRLNRTATGPVLTRSWISRSNKVHGIEAVTAALRLVHGFYPNTSPMRYVRKVLDGTAE